METVKRKKKRVVYAKINRTEMFWLNPQTHNLVSYTRAYELGYLQRTDIRFGIRDLKTKRLISPELALQRKLIKIKV